MDSLTSLAVNKHFDDLTSLLKDEENINLRNKILENVYILDSTEDQYYIIANNKDEAILKFVYSNNLGYGNKENLMHNSQNELCKENIQEDRDIHIMSHTSDEINNYFSKEVRRDYKIKKIRIDNINVDPYRFMNIDKINIRKTKPLYKINSRGVVNRFNINEYLRGNDVHEVLYLYLERYSNDIFFFHRSIVCENDTYKACFNNHLCNDCLNKKCFICGEQLKGLPEGDLPESLTREQNHFNKHKFENISDEIFLKYINIERVD